MFTYLNIKYRIAILVGFCLWYIWRQWTIYRWNKQFKDHYTPIEIQFIDQYTQPIVQQDIFQDLPNIVPKRIPIRQFSDIRNVLFINLDERTDRRDETIRELSRVGFSSVHRLSAIKFTPGAIGCSLSHIKALEYAKEHQWDHVLICEDDVLFGDAVNVQKYITCFLQHHADWDVLLLGANPKSGQYIDKCTARIFQTATTTAYLVRWEYYDVLLHNFKEGARRFFNRIPDSYIDVFWNSLVARDEWYTVLPLVALQRPSQSDIEEKEVDYRKMILDNASRWIKNYPKQEKVQLYQMFDLV